MRLATLITIGMTAVLLSCGVIGSRVMLGEISTRNKAIQGESAARLAALTLTASTRISFERGPTNGALGAELPIPADRRNTLIDSRAATDAALDEVIQALPSTTGAAIIAHSINATRQRLASVRHTIDTLLERPLAKRTSIDLNAVIGDLIAVVPELASALNAIEAVMVQADPSLTSLITIARLCT